MFDIALQLFLAAAVAAANPVKPPGSTAPAPAAAECGVSGNRDGCRPAAPAPLLAQPQVPAVLPPPVPLIAPPRAAQAQTPPPVAAPLAVPPAAPPPLTPAEQAALREELQLWSGIKDSKEPAEFEAFLAAYPNGRLAPVARLRLQALRQPAAAPPARPLTPQPPAQAAAPGPPFALNTATIAEAQEKLYNLNFDVGRINGRIGPETRRAIESFQSRVTLPATGVLDEGTMDRLRASRIAEKWVALSFSARGAYGYAFGRNSRKQAEADALAICRKNARGARCNTVTGGNAACTALSVSDTRRRVGAYAVTRAGKDTARTAALEYCRSNSSSPDACEITALACADGSHQ